MTGGPLINRSAREDGPPWFVTTITETNFQEFVIQAKSVLPPVTIMPTR